MAADMAASRGFSNSVVKSVGQFLQEWYNGVDRPTRLLRRIVLNSVFRPFSYSLVSEGHYIYAAICCIIWMHFKLSRAVRLWSSKCLEVYI